MSFRTAFGARKLLFSSRREQSTVNMLEAEVPEGTLGSHQPSVIFSRKQRHPIVSKTQLRRSGTYLA